MIQYEYFFSYSVSWQEQALRMALRLHTTQQFKRRLVFVYLYRCYHSGLDMQDDGDEVSTPSSCSATPPSVPKIPTRRFREKATWLELSTEIHSDLNLNTENNLGSSDQHGLLGDADWGSYGRIRHGPGWEGERGWEEARGWTTQTSCQGLKDVEWDEVIIFWKLAGKNTSANLKWKVFDIFSDSNPRGNQTADDRQAGHAGCEGRSWADISGAWDRCLQGAVASAEGHQGRCSCGCAIQS